MSVLLEFAGLDSAAINGMDKAQDCGPWKKGGGTYLTEGEEIPRNSKRGIGTCIRKSHISCGYGSWGRQLFVSHIVHWYGQNCVAAALIAVVLNTLTPNDL
jgi:hypothetical protein